MLQRHEPIFWIRRMPLMMLAHFILAQCCDCRMRKQQVLVSHLTDMLREARL